MGEKSATKNAEGPEGCTQTWALAGAYRKILAQRIFSVETAMDWVLVALDKFPHWGGRIWPGRWGTGKAVYGK